MDRPRRQFAPLLTLLCIALLLAGCGQKGRLVLPAEPPAQNAAQ